MVKTRDLCRSWNVLETFGRRGEIPQVGKGKVLPRGHEAPANAGGVTGGDAQREERAIPVKTAE